MSSFVAHLLWEQRWCGDGVCLDLENLWIVLHLVALLVIFYYLKYADSLKILHSNDGSELLWLTSQSFRVGSNCV